MESEAKYAMVGVFVLALSAAMIVFVIWLGQLSFDRDYAEYEVVFKGPVRGLSQAGEVRFNGIKVGEVTQLRLDGENPNIVLARIRIFAETPIKTDSYAQLEPQGITGLSYIQIYGGSVNSPKLERKMGGALPEIPSKQPQLEGLFSSSADVVNSANQAITRINKVLSEENIAAFTQTLANVRDISSQLAKEKDLGKDLASALQSVDSAAKALQTFSDKGSALLDGDTTDMIAEIDAASQELRLASSDARKIMEQIGPPVTEFSNEGLAELTMALADLRAVLQSVNRMVEEIDRDPKEFITGEPLPEMEVPR